MQARRGLRQQSEWSHFLCVQINTELCILFEPRMQMMLAVDVESVAPIATGQRIAASPDPVGSISASSFARHVTRYAPRLNILLFPGLLPRNVVTTDWFWRQ